MGKGSSSISNKGSVVDRRTPGPPALVRDFPSCSALDSNLELFSEASPSRAESQDKFRRSECVTRPVADII